MEGAARREEGRKPHMPAVARRRLTPAMEGAARRQEGRKPRMPAAAAFLGGASAHLAGARRDESWTPELGTVVERPERGKGSPWLAALIAAVQVKSDG